MPLVKKFTLITLLALPPSIAEGSTCKEAADCYCNLISGGCDILISAEVVAKDDKYLTITIQRPPHHDPNSRLDGVLDVDQLEWVHYMNPELGDKGLMRLHTTNPCGLAGAKMTLHAMVLENNGIYLCDADPSFHGIDLEEVLSTVQREREDCIAAVYEMGVEKFECVLPENGCCSRSIASLSNGVVLLCVAGFMFSKRKR